MRLTVDKSTFEVRANAFTLILYEDTFKGRRLLRDVSLLLTGDDDVPISTAVKIIWALAKTADESLPDCLEWSKEFSIAGITEAVKPALMILLESMATAKKSKAAAVRERIFRRLTFWRPRSAAD